MNIFNTAKTVVEVRSDSLTDSAIKRDSDGIAPSSPATNEAASISKKIVDFSSFAQQLSEAESRAFTREISLTRQELAIKGKNIVNKIVGSDYWANRKIHDAEVPKTDDPLHLARAQQSTAFINREGPNPFKGMSREQLSLIAYDESGIFTVNERHAAWSEAYDQDQVQKRIVVAKMNEEYNRTGKVVDSLIDLLNFYKSMPAIDRVIQIPADYEAKLTSHVLTGGITESLENFSSLWGLDAKLNVSQLSEREEMSYVSQTSFNR